jgi:hypothetical protein
MAPLGTCLGLAVTVPTLFAHPIRPRLPKFLCNFCEAHRARLVAYAAIEHTTCRRWRPRSWRAKREGGNHRSLNTDQRPGARGPI